MSRPQEQVGEVLDAMFEKRVDVGDCVIKQGDDGDNFYVIERYVTMSNMPLRRLTCC